MGLGKLQCKKNEVICTLLHIYEPHVCLPYKGTLTGVINCFTCLTDTYYVQHVYINLFTISRYINKLFLGKRYMSHMSFTKSINKRFTVNKPTTSAQIHCVFGSAVINHRMSNNEKFNAQCTTGNQYW